MLPGFVISLALVIALQALLSVGVYFTSLNHRPGLLLSVFSLNLLIGFVVPWYIGHVMWDFATGFFHLSTETVLHTPLTGASALTLFVTLAIPIIYFKSACIPLVRDAGLNYRNSRKAANAAASAKPRPTRLENSCPYERKPRD